jgi:phosphatidylinositol 4-kinase
MSSEESVAQANAISLQKEAAQVLLEVHDKTSTLTITELKDLLFRCAAALVYGRKHDHELVHYLVALPFAVFGPLVISAGIDVWTWVIGERPELETGLVMEINAAWTVTIRKRLGLFSDSME